MQPFILKTIINMILFTGLLSAACGNDTKTIPGFGQLIDPVGDSIAVAGTGTVTLTVQGPNRGLGGTSSGTQQAPRLLQEVEGDFSVTVKVTGEFDPPARIDKNAFNGAGLLIWGNGRNFIRVERNIWVTPGAERLSYTPLIEYWKDGFNRTSRPGSARPFWQGRSTFLKVTRKGEEFAVGLSHDGLKWLDMDTVTAKFPDKINVGLAAINNSDKAFTVEFSEFRLESTQKTPVATTSQPGKKEEKPALDDLWADLYKDEPEASIAVLQLFMQLHKAVPFLKSKLRPLKLDPDRCKELLKDLGSGDEKVWRAAWDELDYLDPRLAIDLTTLMSHEVIERPARTRVVELCSQRAADSLAGKDVKIRPVGDTGLNFMAGNESWWAEHQIDRIGKSPWAQKMSWIRAARGVAILEQIGSAEAVKVIDQMAAGHPDAFPTKAAKESLKRLNR